MSPGQKHKKGKIRVDQGLVSQGLAENLDQAKALVMTGKVLSGDQKVTKPSEWIDPDVELRIQGVQRSKYVSRGGDKIAAAAESLGITEIFSGAVVLDVGSSTGGFTDYAIQHGARHVIAVDVGTNQMAWSLRNSNQVTLFESTHIKNLKQRIEAQNSSDLLDAVSLVVVDVSFNSIVRLLTDILTTVPKSRNYLFLVKPQFELPHELIPAGGIVTNEEHRELAVKLVDEAFRREKFPGGRWVNSAVSGRSGNVEIFYYNYRQEDQESTNAREDDKQ